MMTQELQQRGKAGRLKGRKLARAGHFKVQDLECEVISSDGVKQDVNTLLRSKIERLSLVFSQKRGSKGDQKLNLIKWKTGACLRHQKTTALHTLGDHSIVFSQRDKSSSFSPCGTRWEPGKADAGSIEITMVQDRCWTKEAYQSGQAGERRDWPECSPSKAHKSLGS